MIQDGKRCLSVPIGLDRGASAGGNMLSFFFLPCAVLVSLMSLTLGQLLVVSED